jgi:hypothetical protein
MLSGRELYAIWAPPDSIWSPWVAPAFFAQVACDESGLCAAELATPMEWFERKTDSASAIVIDLPGTESFSLAMQLGGIGYRTVSLINASPARLIGFSGKESPPSVTLDMNAMVREVCTSVNIMRNHVLPPNAPPAFVLDANRCGGTRPVVEHMFDNRWMVFPQDFPSAQFLLEHGIRRVILVQTANSAPQEDLAHVLLRWQESGISIVLKVIGDASQPLEIRVAKPSRFKVMWYRALAALGFRRGNVGGFGAIVPERGSAG